MTLISLLCGVLVGVLAWVFGTAEMTNAEVRAVSTAIGAFSGTALGFLFTALTIFAALFTRDLVQKLKTTGHYSQLVHMMFLAAAIFGAAAVVSVASLFFVDVFAARSASIAVGLCAMALTLLAVAGYRFYLILTNIR